MNEASKTWNSGFIWLPREKYPDLQTTYETIFCDQQGCKYTAALFRKEFILSAPVKKMTLKVSASVKYRLSLNGQLLGRGPIMQGGDYGNTDVLDYWFYDVYTDTSAFLVGENCLAAQVSLQTGIMADYSLGRGGFCFSLELELEDGSSLNFSSDESVCCIPDRGAHSPAEQNGGESPSWAWKMPGYDDSDWDRAEAQFEKELLERPIPLLHEEPVYAEQVKVPNESFDARMDGRDALTRAEGETEIAFGSPLTFVLDFGRITVGRVCLECTGAAGTRVTFHLSEIEGKIDSTVRFTMGEGPQEFETWNLQSLRYLTVTVSNLTSAVVISKLYMQTSCYPILQEGSFCCSDELLNRIYEAGKYTLRFCRQDYHLDSPIHQEALGCTGDYMIESLMNYYTFSDPRLTRLDIWRTAQILRAHDGFMFHTSYSLLYLQMIWDYYLFTGDLEAVLDIMDVIELLLKRFEGYLGEKGVIENAPNYMFMDWVPADGFNLHHPPKAMGQAYLTAIYYHALELGASLFAEAGRDGEAKYWMEKRIPLKKAFQEAFWEEERGLYCDGIPGTEKSEDFWLPDNVPKKYFSQHTNSLAVLYGIAPAELRKEIMKKVMTDSTLIQAQPYFMHFVLNALGEAGLFEEYGLDQIRRWKALLDECPGTLKEVWAGFDCDYSHAWGGTPTFQLPARVLGISPAEPGMKAVEISPLPGNLEWAKGQVPTPYGMIGVSIRSVGGSLSLSVNIPEEIRLEIPNRERFASIRVNGEEQKEGSIS